METDTPGPAVFTEPELHYLHGERLLGRLATVGADGMPHIAPVGWRLDPGGDTISVSGHDFSTTKKFRDVAANGVAAIVIDDVLPPWQPRGVEVRGTAEAIDGAEPRIRIRPTRIVSWGLGEPRRGRRVG
jgi:pyridoxamine 5'-phosphate oxidase family protein